MMKNRLFTYTILSILFCLSFASCQKYSGFKHDSSGYYYHYFNLNENNEQPQIGDFVVVNMGLRTKDTVISPMTRNNMLVDELYRGDIYCALRDMHLGDSATFIFDGPQFYEEFLGMGDYPYGKKPIYVDIKLLKILPKQDLEKAEERYQEQKKQLRHIEDSLILDYVAENRIDTRTNGLYCIWNNKGDGPKVEKNQTVQILIRGRRLDNTLFDNSTDPEHPLTFEAGKDQVSHGIDVMVQNMCVGDQVTVVLPSSYAFGEKGNEVFQIPPYTPVVYDIELLKIIK
jgi:FKBP-type peptidyl-prolyl cis-trans isomerase